MTSSEQQRWVLGEWAKTHPRRGWYPYHIALERKRTITVYGQRWRIHHRVEALATRQVASLSIEPATVLRSARERQLRAAHVFTKMELTIRALSYSGGWSVDEVIRGLWTRPLVNPQLAHEELAFLDRLRFPKNGFVPLSERREQVNAPRVAVAGARKQVTAAWKLFELAKRHRPRGCSLAGIGFQRRGKERLDGQLWEPLVAVYSRESRLFADILPHSRKTEDMASDEQLLRQLERGFRRLGLQGGWHSDDVMLFGSFSRKGPIILERFAAEQKFLEGLRLADVLKLGSEPSRRTKR